jgi:hypothetical protein
MSLDDARRAASGLPVGKAMLSAATAVIIGLSGYTLKTIGDHSKQLSGIEQKVDDLTVAVRDHNTTVDTSLNTIKADQQTQGQAIARLEGQEDQPYPEPRRPTSHAVDPPFPSPLPQIGNALSHLLGLRARGTHGRVRHQGR